MTLAATLQPATDRHGRTLAPTLAIADAHRSPAGHLADLLDAIVLDGNVRAMEGVAAVLVRAGARMRMLADDALDGRARTRRLPVAGSASHRMAERTARRALAGAIADPSRGATRFHRLGDLPAWAVGQKPVVQLGEIVFYRAALDRLAAGRDG